MKSTPKNSVLDLISSARAKGVSPIPLPDKESLVELRKLADYNDTASNRARVTGKEAIEFLRSRGWAGKSKQALDLVCSLKLSRKSWGTK